MRATTADREQSATYTYLICLAAWAIPGAGHLLLGRVQKGLTFLIALTLMFLFGLWLEGRLFPVEIRQPLVALAALADMGIGIAFFIARQTRRRRRPRRRADLRIRQRLSDRGGPDEHAGRPRRLRHRAGTQVSASGFK